MTAHLVKRADYFERQSADNRDCRISHEEWGAHAAENCQRCFKGPCDLYRLDEQDATKVSPRQAGFMSGHW